MSATVEQVQAWLAGQEQAYLVGGCVRDRLLGRPVHDLDVIVPQAGLAVARRLANHFGGAFFPLDETRGVGRAILTTPAGGSLVVDVSEFRAPDLAGDLADRDLTVNALAVDVHAPDEVIDRHRGLAHLKAGVLHPVSGASIRNDPLRALRAVRLGAQLGFSLSPELEALIRRDGPAVAAVSGERIRDELVRLLGLPAAARWLDRLDGLGLLTLVFPELEPLRGLAQPPPHHLDGLSHSLRTVHELEALVEEPAALAPFGPRIQAHLERAVGDSRSALALLKLAALLHDVGKPATGAADDDGRLRFLGHDGHGAALVGEALVRLRLSSAEVRLGATIVRQHMRPLLLIEQPEVTRRAAYRFFRDTGEAAVEVLLLALADHQATYSPGGGTESWNRLVALAVRLLEDRWEHAAERVAPPPLLDGYDLQREFGLAPGPMIGELLDAVREGQAAGEIHSREEALAAVRRWVVSGRAAQERREQFE